MRDAGAVLRLFLGNDIGRRRRQKGIESPFISDVCVKRRHRAATYRILCDARRRILVIKDSYANCFAPYLTANYADIDVVDFRNYNYGLDKLIADNAYDQLLVLYSFDSFKSDPYLYRAGVAG